MARVVVLGAGISGHTAALHLRRRLSRGHEVVVVSPNANWSWIPSNIWVGVGRMNTAQVTFPLRPVYRRKKIEFRQSKAVAFHPEGDSRADNRIRGHRLHRSATRRAKIEQLAYDYLINATGPKLNFAATPGVGPDGNSLSVCTAGHAEQAAAALDKVVETLRRGERQTLVIGVGHGACTCEGAAFEYTFNVEHELHERGVRELADVVYLSNEYDLGDFGVGACRSPRTASSPPPRCGPSHCSVRDGVRAILRAHVERVDPGVIHYEQLDGEKGTLAFDFAMLLPVSWGRPESVRPPRRGHHRRAVRPRRLPASRRRLHRQAVRGVDRRGLAGDHQSPRYHNLFGVGIAFAPPHPISRPRTTPTGTVISPAPPRTGMPSGVIGRVVAESIAERIRHGDRTPLRTASMASMGAACIASAGAGCAPAAQQR